MAKNDFQYGGWNSYTLQCGTILTLISPRDCTLQCGMWLWNHDSEFIKWQHHAMWYVALGWYAIEFTRWQHPAMWHVTLESWHWIRQVAAPCSVAGGSGMTCHWIRRNVRRPPYWNSIIIWFRLRPYHHGRHVILHQSAKFYQNQTTLNRKKWYQFSRWRISAILDFRGPMMGSLKSPCTTSYRSSIDTIALNCLVFEKIAYLHVGKKAQTWQISRILDVRGKVSKVK